jgi:hypothetical protein
MPKSRRKFASRRSHAVFLLVDRDVEDRLSGEARDGLHYASRLAERDRQRSRAALHGEPLPPSSIKDLALNEAESAATIRRRIATARQEIWGDLSDAGIYYRVRRSRRAVSPEPRYCEAPGCGLRLPDGSTLRRRFCHGSCRTSAYRARKRVA